MQRAESVTSQAGGKGVNISRAAVAAGIPTIAVLPAAKDDPFVLELLARRHRLPAGARRPATSASTSRSPSPTAPPPSSTAPAPTATHGILEPRWRTRCSRGPTAPTGWCWPARCPPAPRPTGTPSWSPPCADAGARVAVDTSDAPLRALVDGAPGLGAPT